LCRGRLPADSPATVTGGESATERTHELETAGKSDGDGNYASDMRPPLCYSPMPIRHLISEQGTRVTVTVAGAFSLLVPTQFRYECVAAIVRGHPLNAIRQMRGPPMFAEDKMRRLAPVECKRASIRERDAAVGACVHSRHAMIERESMSAERRAAQRSLLVAHDRVDRAVCLASHERILRAVRKEALGQPRGIGHVHLAVPPVARPQCEWGRAALADACCAERVRGLAPAIHDIQQRH